MSRFFRKRIEDTIEHMIQLLDEMDGDPDLEEEPLEEQHDLEADVVGTEKASLSYVLAETHRRRQRVVRR